MENLDKINNEFKKRYNDMPEEIYFAPGRVNLIGEHIDYNGGLVFPCALTVGTYLALRKRDDDKIFLQSLNFEEKLETSLAELKKTGQWFDYPIGILKLLKEKGGKFTGMEILFYGTIPNSSGLSSSASIELATAYALNEIANMGIDTIDLVKLSQEVENKYIGVNCGIMDQFAVGMGKKEHAIALDCNSLSYEYVPIELNDYALLISNTNSKRKLSDSKYNERLSECQEALKIAKQSFNINNLCSLDIKELEKIKDKFKNITIYKRAKHVVTEQVRVEKAIKFLKAGNLKAFGELMNASHDSLRDDYEVTGEALDTLVYEGRKIDGVIGSRMTGAGFGGCTVTLLHKNSIEEYKKKVSKTYQDKMGILPEFYTVGIGHGVIKLKN